MKDSFLIFESHRQRLFGVAYRMLGSRAEAEDILQEAYLRWHSVAADEVRSDIAAEELLGAVASLCMHAYAQGPKHARRMVSLLVDGLRYGAEPPPASRKAARRKT